MNITEEKVILKTDKLIHVVIVTLPFITRKPLHYTPYAVAFVFGKFFAGRLQEILIAPWVCRKYGAQKALWIPRKKSAKNGVYLKFRSFLRSRLHSDAKMRFLKLYGRFSQFRV